MAVRWRDIFRLLVRDPGKLAAFLYWYTTGRRVRAVGRLKAAVAALPFAYQNWLTEGAADDRRILASLSQADRRERAIDVHLHVGARSAARDIKAAIASVISQSWSHWTLTITVEDGSAFTPPSDPRVTVITGNVSRAAGLVAAIDATRASYLVPLREDCRLPAYALAAYAAAIGSIDDDAPPILYGDQDELGPTSGRRNPWFKPDWDPDMALAQDYVSTACAIPVNAARAALRFTPHTGRDGAIAGDADGAVVYALLLSLALVGGQCVRHLYRTTMSTPPDDWSRSRPDRMAVLRAFLASHGDVSVVEGPFGTAQIDWPLPARTPLVSIIVPTRDHVDLLRCCVDGVLNKTRYRNIQLIIVDNGSVEPETLQFLRDIVSDARVQIVAWPHAYNYSAINNFAQGISSGDYICLLNNDIEIIDEDWLSQLMRQACRPGIGAVGARLLYPDRTIQHAGVILGMGNAAGHAHRGIRQGEPGYFAHALVTRRCAAVTAACLVVSRSMFEAVGGLDEDGMRIAYNDVDFCLKIRETGAVNIYSASAILIHHESKSRGPDMAPEHRERYYSELAILQQRWGTVGLLDPAHHPALDRHSEQFRTVQ